MFKRFLLLFLLISALSPTCFGAFDGTKPLGTTPIASYPPIIRENLRALKDDAIVNAGRIASLTPVQIGGEFFSCVASTTSTAFYNSSGTVLLLGSATGTHNLIVQVSNNQNGTSTAYLPFSCTKFFSVWVATTTEILGRVKDIRDTYSTSLIWDVGIATSTTRGQITFTASCAAPLGSLWILRVHRNTGGPLW